LRYAKIWIFLGLLAIGSALSWALFDQGQNSKLRIKWALPIVPHPQEIRLKNKEQSFIINPNTRILVSRTALKNRVEVELLNAALNRHSMQSLEVGFLADDFHNSIIVGEFRIFSSTLAFAGSTW